MELTNTLSKNDVLAIIRRMQDECLALGPCKTDEPPCSGCMQLARLAGEIEGHDEGPTLPLREQRPCSLGVGCEQYGVCYADAHGQPEKCGRNVEVTPQGGPAENPATAANESRQERLRGSSDGRDDVLSGLLEGAASPTSRDSQMCPSCGSSMTFQTKSEGIGCGAYSKRVPIETWWCNACGEAIFEGESLRILEDELAELAEISRTSRSSLESPEERVAREKVEPAAREALHLLMRHSRGPQHSSESMWLEFLRAVRREINRALK